MLNKSETDVIIDLYQIPPVLILLLTLFYFLVSFTAIVGNSMILWIVYRSKRMKCVTNYFIANLAASDLLIGAFSIPFQFQAALLQKWVLPDFMCPFCPTIQVISLNVSIFTLVVLSWDRYQAVIYPLKPKTSKKRVKCLLVIIWVFSTLLAIPTTIAFRVEFVDDESEAAIQKPFCNIIGLDSELWRSYSYTLVALQYCFPLLFISYAYLRMGITLFARDLPGDESGLGNADHAIRRKRKTSFIIAKFCNILHIIF
ncbi:tachykinin-like peptides receptor 99D [Leptotrombidium deliense]|uniref:Tachykinin-like peptides receptor 99D n=1 Tax=Leptotrombidium deliense TaxID=299467 RepID=A0A443SHB7_9ACAR|nr:tachykinin-like peptides receptor 99D [Leptotrombidium deliense]